MSATTDEQLRIVEVPDAEYGKKYELRGANNILFSIFIFRHNAEEWFDSIQTHSKQVALAARRDAEDYFKSFLVENSVETHEDISNDTLLFRVPKDKFNQI